MDLSLYSEKHQAATLIGSPPGYRDTERQGILFEWFHANRAGVILLDEIEKAHERVQLMWLGALDEGCITNAKGRAIDLSQCTIVFTTNAVTSKDLNRQPVGFRGASDGGSDALLASHFPAEFLGRTRKVVFNALGPAQVRKILRLRIDEAMASIRSQGHRVVYDEDTLLDFLSGKLERMDGGARDIARLIDEVLLQPMAHAMASRPEIGEANIALDDGFYLDGRVGLDRIEAALP